MLKKSINTLLIGVSILVKGIIKMNKSLCIALLITLSGCSIQHTTSHHPTGNESPVAISPEVDICKNFKAKYHRWVLSIYENPDIMISSLSCTYTNLPEFNDIVELGKPAVPYIINEINKKSDWSLFLGEAILRIMKWERSEFKYSSLQGLNRQLIERYHNEIKNPNRNQPTR